MLYLYYVYPFTVFRQGILKDPLHEARTIKKSTYLYFCALKSGYAKKTVVDISKQNLAHILRGTE